LTNSRESFSPVEKMPEICLKSLQRKVAPKLLLQY
jgi:hypothetical protein